VARQLADRALAPVDEHGQERQVSGGGLGDLLTERLVVGCLLPEGREADDVGVRRIGSGAEVSELLTVGAADGKAPVDESGVLLAVAVNELRADDFGSSAPSVRARTAAAFAARPGGNGSSTTMTQRSTVTIGSIMRCE
jgi:hypothetical protein